LHWIKCGAKPSATVHNLLVSEKIIDARKIHVARAKKVVPTETPAAQPTQSAPVENSSEAKPEEKPGQ
jgi:hypothetical protein